MNLMNYNLVPCVSATLVPNYGCNVLLSQMLGTPSIHRSSHGYLGTPLSSLYETGLPLWQQTLPRDNSMRTYNTLLPTLGAPTFLSSSKLFSKQIQAFPELPSLNITLKPSSMEDDILRRQQLHTVSKKIHKIEDSQTKPQKLKVGTCKTTMKKRFRRKACQVERFFKCQFPGCSKAYG